MGCGVRSYNFTSDWSEGRFTQTDPILGNRPTKRVKGPEGIARTLLSAYLVHRRETLNSRGKKDPPRTLNTHLLAVRQWLSYLAREGIVPPSLPATVEYVKAPETLPRDIPTDAEIARMIRSCDTTRTTGF